MKKILLITALFMLSTITKAQTIYYVDIDATGTSDGSSWADADTSLSNALSMLPHSEIEVWAAEGIYKPQGSFAWIQDSIEVYGGFNGTETLRSERDWKTNETIMSGDIGVIGDETDNASPVFSGPLVLPFAPPGAPTDLDYGLLDGFTIQDGYNDNASGSGIFMNDDVYKLIIQNCHIKNNKARNEAAIFASAEANDKELVINSCIISGNEGRRGIGTSVRASGKKMKLTITNSLYYDNTIVNLPNFGSGTNGVVTVFTINDDSELDVEITNTTFAQNHNGGWSSGNSKATIDYNSVSAVGSKQISINNCIFWGNTGDSLSFSKHANSVGPADIAVTNTLSEYEIYANSALVSNVINSDPMFTNLLNYDFSLQDNSPALNQGTTLNLTIPTEDLAGNTRIVNDTIDLGCYENQKIIVIANPNGISDLSFQNLSVYPNPTNDILNLEIEEDLIPIAIGTIKLFDLTGKMIQTFNPENKQLDVSVLTKGVYFLEVANAEKRSVIKILKR